MLAKRIVDTNGCWVWQGRRANGHSLGYGTMWYFGKIVRVHRLAAHLWLDAPLYGPHHVCHHCDNPPCFNPEHLYVGSALTNGHDRSVRGRSTGGPKRRLLTDGQAAEIRARKQAGESLTSLRDRFGVSYSIVWQITTGRSYRTSR